MNIDKNPEGGLLQSKEWVGILKEEGREVVDISGEGEGFFGVVSRVPVIGSYVYFPRMKNIEQSFIAYAQQCTFPWIRIDIDSESDMEVLQKTGHRIVRAPHNMQPKENLIIDISKSEEELLAQMKSKTRYNIRLAQKKGVKIITSKEQKYIDAFYGLVSATEKRKNVSFHDKDHYEKMINNLSDENVALFSAEYDGEIIASNLITFFGSTATYLHGATSDQHRNVMAPFLLQWHIMQDAIQRKCQWYDFGGIFPDEKDPGKIGITRFKKGFAPNEKSYETKGSYDIVLNPWKYKVYRLLQKLR